MAADTHEPSLRPDGETSRFILGEMNGQATLRDIAHRLHTQFLDRFPAPDEAVKRVARVSRKFSR